MGENKHDVGMSIVKAICIILMVVRHSSCPAWIGRAIILFHMPCFFLISGYFLSDVHILNYKRSILSKVKNLWWYFVKWSIVFILLHNIFHFIHMYNEPLTLYEMGKKSLMSLLMWQNEDLLGGYWFLKDLFKASVLTIIIFRIILWIKPNFSIAAYGWILILPFIIYATFVEKLGIYPPNKTGAMAVAFFMTGVWLRAKFGANIFATNKNNLTIGLSMMGLLLLLSIWYTNSMPNATYYHVPIYFVIAIWGSISVMLIARGIASRKTGVWLLDFIGAETITILTFHFLCFKLVSYAKVYLYDMDIARVSEFPVIEENNSYFWIFYTVVGIALPLSVKYMFDKLKLNKNINLISRLTLNNKP